MTNTRLIAFYLPQFYPTPENDAWWEPGFTEWTNVKRAKPLFPQHDQPRQPGELGYYDLRDVAIRERQAKMARDAGIEGFCYWHYWFAGRRLLDTVFNEVVSSGHPDYPFCLCWANHSWYKKTWDPSKPDALLMEQTYPGLQDYVDHFNAMLPAFKDSRYLKVDGRLIFGVYAPLDLPDFLVMKNTWNRLAQENGLGGFYFFGFTFEKDRPDIHTILERGFDAVVVDHIFTAVLGRSRFAKLMMRTYRKLLGRYPLLSYDKYSQTVLADAYNEAVHPCILPNFDHSPRSGRKGIIMTGHSPVGWGKLCAEIFQRTQHRKHNLVFIKSWNEWGEGNYLEPDAVYGRGFLQALSNAILKVK
ncbi:MAG: glycoside hydrolase family 99-like domain-containing protein [Prevotella sp.]|nr:glycoside hydrolase family 99-like domain-containing protein [Prevotella sp.]